MQIRNPTIDLRLASESGSISRARQSLQALEEEVPPQTLQTVVLLVSELVTNAVLHAGLEPEDEIGLKVGSSAGTIRAEVHDRGPGFDAGSSQKPDPDQTGGWGLYLVGTLSDRWGVERGDLVVVWFELDHDE